MSAVFQVLVGNKEVLRKRLFLSTIILFGVGLYFLFYAYTVEATNQQNILIFRELAIQVISFLVGMVLLFIATRIRYQLYHRFILLVGTASCLMMLSLLSSFAVERNGAVRWIDFGIFQFQPSEAFKIGFILLFAYLFSNKRLRGNVKELIAYTLGAFSILVVISILQPDYGTMLILGVVILSMAVIAKLPRMWWVVIAVAGLIGGSIIATTPEHVVTRIDTFYTLHFGEFTAEQRYGNAYHALQNIHAVRTGGFFGQGSGHIAQSSELNIPEVSTDSIFALVAAETGFLGSFLLILLFLYFFFLCYSVAEQTKDPFGRFLVAGITTMFAVQFFINILVVLGFPVTGIPLIFFSRGGSSLVLTMISVGIIINVLSQQSPRRSVYHGSLQ